MGKHVFELDEQEFMLINSLLNQAIATQKDISKYIDLRKKINNHTKAEPDFWD